MWVVYAAWWKEDNGVGSFSWAGGLLRNNGGSWKQGLEKLRNNGAWAGNSYDEDKDGKNYKMETAKWMWLHSEMENKRNESSISLRRVWRVSQACYIHSEIFTLQRVIHTKMVQSPSPSPPPSPMQRWCWDAAQLWVKAYVDNFFGYFQILFFLLQI